MFCLHVDQCTACTPTSVVHCVHLSVIFHLLLWRREDQYCLCGPEKVPLSRWTYPIQITKCTEFCDSYVKIRVCVCVCMCVLVVNSEFEQTPTSCTVFFAVRNKVLKTRARGNWETRFVYNFPVPHQGNSVLCTLKHLVTAVADFYGTSFSKMCMRIVWKINDFFLSHFGKNLSEWIVLQIAFLYVLLINFNCIFNRILIVFRYLFMSCVFYVFLRFFLVCFFYTFYALSFFCMRCCQFA